MARILVVDDEPALVSTIAYNLRREGHTVLTASDGVTALEVTRRDHPDLLVLDLMLPRMDGLEVCRAIRQTNEPAVRTVPILMLTAKATEMDKVVGLEVGADDYLTKPFSMRELLARIKAMLRRTQMEVEEPPQAQPIVFGNLAIDPGQRRVTRGSKEISFKPKEFELLSFLLKHPGQVFTREQLLDQVWGRDFVGDNRTVDVHVRWLREKIEKSPSKPKILETIRGVGYRVRTPEKTEKPAKAEKPEGTVKAARAAKVAK